MAQQLKNTLALNVAPGATVVVPHELHTENGLVAPDIIFVPSGDLEITSDETNITVRNVSAATVDGEMLVEYWHTIERAFGDTANQDLPTKPYIVVTAGGGNQPPQPPFALTRIKIYARLTGSDTTGDGSLANPYRTFQRAVRDVPEYTGWATYYVDYSGIGDEVLADDYTLPAWKSAGGRVFTSDPDYARYFLSETPVNLVAVPQPVDGLGADGIINFADGGISQDPITGLWIFTFNAPRAALAGTKGKRLIVSATASGNGAIANSVIYEAAPDGSYLKMATANPWIPTVDDFPLTVMEPSATLHGAGFTVGGALSVFNADCISIKGTKIYSDFAEFGVSGIFQDGDGMAVFELCDLDNPWITANANSLVFGSSFNRLFCCYITITPPDGSALFSNSFLFVQSFAENLPWPMFFAPCNPIITHAAFVGCGPLEPVSYGPGTGTFYPSAVPHFHLQHAVIKDGTGDGVIFHGNTGLFSQVDFSNNTDNGLTVKGGAGVAQLLDCGSTTPNGGLGVNVDDGMQVLVDADTSTTQPTAGKPLTGSTGDMQVGSLAVRTWNDFVAGSVGHAAKNEYDITSVSATGATGTGSRLSQPT